MKLMRALFFGIVGPAAALIVTWQPAITVANISAGRAPDPHIVSQLRAVPDESILRELREFAVSYPRFGNLAPEEVLEIANRMLAGKYVPEGGDEAIRIPFQPNPYYFGLSSWHLDLHSFAIPSLLGRAYEVSDESKYIQFAVEYILDRARYESSLILPRGYFFNDHAIAARSIVVTEIWRLYRNSAAFEIGDATELLHYAQKLTRLLLDDRLYEYRTNHGIMQCLSLMHLATAFPLLNDAEQVFNTGWERLDAQLEFFVNAEGIVLEHSSGYHLNGVNRLAAAWRYLGLNGVAVPDDMISRYAKALDFSAALRRPDDTLPLIGDTVDYDYSPYRIAEFGDDGVASDPLRDANSTDLEPDSVTVAAGAGYVILWSGVQRWPASEGLAQTVFHWGNFPTKVHKHADELSISIWADGSQWLRGVGSWPLAASRRDAIGWRSSNGPHWLGEEPEADRASSLEDSATSEELSFFDVRRENADGREIRRQLVRLGTRTWVIVDSFNSPHDEKAETVWRFSPHLTLRPAPPAAFELSIADKRMRVLTAGMGNLTIDADEGGEADWNSGLISDGEIVPSPAVRIQTDDDHRAVVTVFRLQNLRESAGSVESVDLRWRDSADWTVTLADHERNTITIERLPTSVAVKGIDMVPVKVQLSKGIPKSGSDAMNQALNAYESAAQRYGEPFSAMLERRTKVTAAILLAAIFQIATFIIVASRFHRRWPQVLIASSLAWLGLSLFLGLHFLV